MIGPLSVLHSSSGLRSVPRRDVPAVGAMLWTPMLEMPIWSVVADMTRYGGVAGLKNAELICAQS
jgi:hypothetical protein